MEIVNRIITLNTCIDTCIHHRRLLYDVVIFVSEA